MNETGEVTHAYKVIVEAAVHEAEARPVPYSRSDGTYRPAWIQVVYRWNSGDTDQAADVRLSGNLMRKDGTEGRHKREDLWSRNDWPVWVAEFVALHRPRVDVIG